MKKIYSSFSASCKKVTIAFLAVLFCLMINSEVGWGQTTTVPFTTPGTTTWFCPAGVTSITVSAWGGGGAGGGINGKTKAGGGGEGGSFVRGTISVVPGTSYTIIVGNGGTGADDADGADGQSSSFKNGATILFNAIGGDGGKRGNSFGAGGNLANSGNISNGTSTSNFYGGNGGTASNSQTASSGGGGGSAGAGGNGGDGGVRTAGAAGAGSGAPTDAGAAAAAGRGSSNDGDGLDGNAPGAGGSGARNANDGTDYSGGKGGNGRINIIYTTPLTYKSQLVSFDVTEGGTKTTTWCAGETRNVVVKIKNIGTAAWTDIPGVQDINVGLKWNTNGTSWADYYVRVDAQNLATGATGTYTFAITASNATAGPTYGTPLAAGTNNLICDVVYEAVSWFGDNNGGVGPGNVKFTSATQTISSGPAQPSTITGTTTVCAGSTQTYSVTAVAGVSYAWNLPTGWAYVSGQNSNSVTYTVGTSGGTVQVTPTNGCGDGTPRTLAVTVNADATIALSSATGTDAQTSCQGISITAIRYNIGGSGTGANLTGSLPTGVNGSYAGGVFTISGTPSSTGTFNYTVTTTGPCVRPALSGTLTITASGTVTLSSGVGTDNQTKCINNALTNIIYNIGGDATGASITAGTLPAGVSGAFGGGVFSITGTPTESGIFNYTVTASGSSCANFFSSGTITVNDDATLTFTSAAGTDGQTKCISNAITPITYSIGGFGSTGATVSGLPTGVSGSYNSGTKVFTISGSPSVAGTFNYTVSTTGPCVKPTATGSITVQANSVISRTSAAGTDAQTKCINTGLTPITYSVTGGGTGASITAGTLPTGVTGAFSGGVFTISGTPTASGSFSYTVTTSGPCNNVSSSGTITVNDDATLTFTSAAGTDGQTKCISNAITPITYSIGGFGSTGATVSGLPTGVSGSYNSGTKVFTISGTPSVSGTFNYTVSTTGPCVKPTATGSITVQANSVISRTSAAGTDAQTKCINTGLTPITYSVTGGGTGASITAGALPTGVTGAFSGGVFTISGTPTASGSFSYTVTTSGPCNNVSSSGTITVNDDATLTFTSAAGTDGQTKCISNAITPITYSIGGFGSTGATVSGLPTGVSGSYNSGTKVFTISGTPSVSGTFNYTVSTTGPCVKPTMSGTITVTPDATVTLSSGAGSNIQTVCQNTAITSITYAIGGSGTGATASGLPAGLNALYSGSVFTISGNPTASGTFNYTVTTTGPCAKPALSGTITVLAAPTGTFSPSATTICDGSNATFTFLPAALGSYVFKVNGIQKQTGTANTYSTAALQDGDIVTVDVANSNNCGATFTSAPVTVTPLPVALLSVTENSGTPNDNTICVGDNITFTASPTGGSNYNFKVNGISVYSGTSNTFSSTTIANNQSVTVDVTKGCVGTSTAQIITVNPLPNGSLTATQPTSTCEGGSFAFSANGGISYQFRVDGVIQQAWSGVNTFSLPATLSVDGSVVTVDVANGPNGTGCTTTYTPGIPVNVNSLPTGTIAITENSGTANNAEICQGSPVTYTFSNTSYTSYVWKINGITKPGTGYTFTTTELASNTDLVTVDVTDNSCSQTFTANAVTVVAAPPAVLTVAPATTICLGDNATFTSTPLDATYNYNFKVNGTSGQNGIGNNTFSTTALPVGTYPVTVVVTNSNSCVTTSSAITMTVNPLPTGTLVAKENYGTPDDGIICEGGTVIFTVTPAAGLTNFNFLLNGVSVQNGASNTFNNTANSILLHTGDKVTVAITGAGGCIGILNTITVTVNPLPTVAAIQGADNVCKSGTITLTDATNTPAGVWSSANTAIATVDALGVVTGLIPGTAVINYTYTNGSGCSSTVSKTITVNAPPVVDAISGNVNVCKSVPTPLTDNTPSGVWSSSNTAIATVDVNGEVTGISNGSATIKYTVTDAVTGCSTEVGINIAVDDAPVVGDIAGPTDVCIGGNITLTDATAGGVWSSSDDGIATVSQSGVVTGVSANSVIISYIVSTSCGTLPAKTYSVTVNAPPSATISYGPNPYCSDGGPISIVSQTGTMGGAFSITGGLAIDPATGTITPGSTGGTYTVTYTVAASGGCSVYTTTATVIITSAPSATIAYAGPYCTSSAAVSVNRTGTAGGTYSYTGAGTLAINATTGTITPASSAAGTYTITYTVAAANGCALYTAPSATVTITQAPSGTFSYAASPYCTTGGTVNITNNALTPGGSFSAPAGLTINSFTGAITTGTSTGGTYTVTYTVNASAGCAAFTPQASVTIATAPSAVAGTQVQTCANSGAVNITAGASASNYSNIVWSGAGSFTNANSLTLATYTPTPAEIAAGTATITLTANANTPCAAGAVSTKTLIINAVTPVTSVTASPSTICLGSSSNLFVPNGTSSLISENFEGTSTFSVVSTGSNQPASSWINRTSTYTYQYGCFFIFCNYAYFNSNSKFMLANSDDGGGNTNTALVSASVSTIGYTSLNFSYRTFYQGSGSDRGYVEVSTNGGTTWTAVQTLSSNTGSQGAFSTQTFNLNAYINQASVMIRFRYSANNGNWWAVDDVSLTGTSTAGNYSWTATPSATAGLPANSGTPSQSNANIVVTPTAAGNYTYTATLTNASGCTSTKDVAVTVNPIPVVSILTDYCAIPNKVLLTATASPGATFSWNTGKTTDTIQVDVAGAYTVTATLGGCSATATSNVATELVTNGNFEAGDGGFTTLYTTHTGSFYTGSGTSGLYPEGYYAVDKSAYSPSNGTGYHPQFHGRDHTTGTGNFMMINGAVALKTIWQETVSILPNTTYYFSAWGMNLNPGSPAQLRFEVNGVQAGSIGDLSLAPMPTSEGMVNTGNWIRFYGTWTSGPTITSAIIKIINLNTIAGGNDFGLDDVSFGTLSTFITLISAPGTDAQTVCKNSAITNIVYNVGNGSVNPPTVTGYPAGVTWSFVGNTLTFTGTPTVAGKYTYTITTATTSGCAPATATGTITVQEDSIKLTSGSAAPVCKDALMTPLVYTVGGTATGASIPPGILPVGVTGVYDAGTKTFTISGTPSVAAGSYPYTITTSGSTCPGSAASITGTITVQAQIITLASAASTTNQTKCINTSISNVQYTIGGTGTGATISWSPSIPTGITGTYQSGIFTIKGTPTVSGTFNYIVSTTGTCSGATATGTITVTPAASLVLTSAPGTDAQTGACNNLPITDITYAVNDATGASLTAGALPAGVTGNFAGGVFTISGSPSVGGTFNYTITTSGGCATASKSGTITVTSQTIVLSGGNINPSICQGAALSQAIVYTIGGTATSASVVGLPAGLTGVVSGNTFTISGIATDPAGSYNYTVTTSGGSCAAATAVGTVTIQAAPVGGTLTSTSGCSGSTGTLTLQNQIGNIARWESSTDNGATWTQVMPNNTSISLTYSNITVPTQYRVVLGNNCSTVTSSVASITLHNYWVGGDIAKPTDWNTAANWSDGQIPSATFCSDVYIPSTPNQPVLSGGATSTITNLHIASGAKVTINGTGLMQVAGVISNLGIFDVTAGTIEFNGTNQTLSGSVFKDMAIKNLIVTSAGSGLSLTNTVGDTLKILNTLTFGNATADLTTNGNLTLTSTISNTASVGVLASGNVITGDVTVERYIATGTVHPKSWQLLAIPTSGTQAINLAWQEGSTVPNSDPHPGYGIRIGNNGAGTGGFDATTSAAPTMKSYDYTIADYKGVSGTNIPIYNKKGYFVFVRGDRSVSTFDAPKPTTLRSKGALFTPANPPASTTVFAGKFESMGNPYASAIDIRKTNFGGGAQQFFQVWDPNLGGAYGYGGFQTLSFDGTNYIATPGGGIYSGSYNYIQSGQAFFVQANGTDGTVSFDESAKAGAGSNVLFTTPSPVQQQVSQLRTTLYDVNTDGSTGNISDGILNQFSESFTNAIDGMDARKQANTGVNLGIKTTAKLLAVERKKIPTEQDTIFLNLTGVSAQNYRFHFDAANLGNNLEAFLEDSYLKTRTPISVSGSTDISFTVVNVAGSYAADRFRIVFATKKPLPVTFTSLKAYQQDKNINVEWRVENEANMKQYEVEKSTDSTSFSSIAVKQPSANNGGSAMYLTIDAKPVEGYNYYRIRSVDMSGKVSYTNVVKVLIGTFKQDIVIYPNPITDGMIHLQLMNQPEGRYKIRLINKIGQLITQKEITRAGGSTTELIKWDYNLAHGLYQLEVIKPDGSVTELNVMY